MDGTERCGVLIVGAGQAGASAAAALRGFGYAGRIVLAGDEQHAPYERPPLSKAMLTGEGAVDDILLHPPAFHAEQSIELWLGASVSSLDTEARTARLADGRRLEWEHCLLATGGRARLLPGLPAEHERVFYLRTADDAQRLRRALREQRSVLVLGGGFLGLEVASTARALGLDTTVLERGERLLDRVMPPLMSQWLRQRVEMSGVALKTNTRCDAFELDADGVAATLADGSRIAADILVVAAGQLPEVALAAASGIALHAGNGGIRVDARCRTSAPGVYAAGDCASQHHPFLDGELRLESWQNANEQARLAAAAIAGVPTAGLSAPWFWSDQFGCNLQMYGLPREGLVYHCRGDAAPPPGAPKFLMLGFDAGQRLVHAIAVNAGGDLRGLKALVDSRLPCDAQALCDLAQPLKQQVRAALARTPIPAIS